MQQKQPTCCRAPTTDDAAICTPSVCRRDLLAAETDNPDLTDSSSPTANVKRSRSLLSPYLCIPAFQPTKGRWGGELTCCFGRSLMTQMSSSSVTSSAAGSGGLAYDLEGQDRQNGHLEAVAFKTARIAKFYSSKCFIHISLPALILLRFPRISSFATRITSQQEARSVNK